MATTSNASFSSTPSSSSNTTDTVPHAADWNQIWDNGVTPGTRFDISGPNLYFKARIDADPSIIPFGRALVPGMGRGYDIQALVSPQRYVIGIDVSPTAVKEANTYLNSVVPSSLSNQYELIVGDFFTYAPHELFDLIYDYTFLCALLPSSRARWAEQMGKLLKSGGILFCLEFPLGPYGETHPKDQPLDYTKGPPFLLTKNLYHTLLEPVGFECIEEKDIDPALSFPKRAGVEAVSIWRKK